MSSYTILTFEDYHFFMVALEKNPLDSLFGGQREPQRPLTPREKVARQVNTDLLTMGNYLMHHLHNDFPAPDLTDHLSPDFVKAMSAETPEETALFEKYHIDRSQWNLGTWSMALAAAKLYPTVVEVTQGHYEHAREKGLDVDGIQASLQKDPSGAEWIAKYYKEQRPRQRGQQLSELDIYGIRIATGAIEQQFAALS